MRLLMDAEIFAEALYRVTPKTYGHLHDRHMSLHRRAYACVAAGWDCYKHWYPLAISLGVPDGEVAQIYQTAKEAYDGGMSAAQAFPLITAMEQACRENPD